MIFSIGEIVEFVSSVSSVARRCYLTGTPDGVSKVFPGDEIKIKSSQLALLLI